MLVSDCLCLIRVGRGTSVYMSEWCVGGEVNSRQGLPVYIACNECLFSRIQICAMAHTRTEYLSQQFFKALSGCPYYSCPSNFPLQSDDISLAQLPSKFQVEADLCLHAVSECPRRR